MSHNILITQRGARRSVLVLVLALSSILVFASGASAATLICPPGPGAGQCEGPHSVAVDQTNGIVYIGEESGDRIDEFDHEGHFLRAFGWGILNGAEELQVCTIATGCQSGFQGPGVGEIRPDALAVDQSTGNLYAADRFKHRVEEFTPAGQFVLEFGKDVDRGPIHPGNLCTATFIEEGDTCGAGTEGAGPGEIGFVDESPLAFDPSGDLWVGDIGRLERFSPAGAFLSEVELFGAGEVFSLAIDASSDFYALSREVAGVQKLAPSGTPFGSPYPLDAAGHPKALGLDPAAGNLFVADEEGEGAGATDTLLEFNPSGEETEAFGTGEVTGQPTGNTLAFGDFAKTLYVADSAAHAFSLPAPGPLVQAGSAGATEIHKTAATLNATVNPEGKAATTHFQYIAEEQFKEDGETFGVGTVTTPESASIGEDFAEHSVSAAVTGLKFDTPYRFRAVATNSNGVDSGETGTFTTLPPLRIDSTSASEVAATSATLDAEINPLGEGSTYHFEYIADAAYLENGGSFSGLRPAVSIPQPAAGIGSGEEDVKVNLHLQGLSPNTVYRYRVVAVDSIVPAGVAGPVLAFTTQGSGAPLVLPDGREWELVSPPDKHGAGIVPLFILAPGTEASAAGGAMAYMTTAPIEGEPAGNANFTQVLASRGPIGWASRDIAIPHREATGLSDTVEEYRVFSSDLSLAVMQPFGAFNLSLSEEASEQTAYLRTNYAHGNPGDLCMTSCYHPLVTGAAGFENVSPGTEFGISNGKHATCPPEPLCGPQILGTTSDLAHIVLFSKIGLTSFPGDDGGLYEWSDGRLQLVSILPDGKPAVGNLGVGQGSVGGIVITPTVPRQAISADGSRVYFTNEGSLYAREDVGTPQARTVAVPGGTFQTASADGSKAFVVGGEELSEFDLESEASVVLAHGVKGVIGASEDGSSVYFIADTVLTGEAENARGEKAEAGQPNLYLYQAGSMVFIATLAAEDSPDWGNGGSILGSDLLRMTARVSPNGDWLTFMSQRSLTGYDNRDVVSGVPDQEVYLYRSPPEGGEGALVCASCDPTGARPHGVEYRHLEFSESAGLVGGGSEVWEEAQWLAANVPTWTSPYHQSRYLSDSGRLFFNSSDALVPQDTDGTEDVYEYEPGGTGNCTATGPAFDKTSGGCIGLISSGRSPEESGFLDASEDGSDVFFLTVAQLSPTDTDTSLDVYDAHECSASVPCYPAPPPPLPACEGDACQSPVEVPNDSTPGSFTFTGPGNQSTPVLGRVAKPKAKPLSRSRKLAAALGACEKKPRKKQAACRARAQKRYGATKAKRSANAIRRVK